MFAAPAARAARAAGEAPTGNESPEAITAPETDKASSLRPLYAEPDEESRPRFGTEGRWVLALEDLLRITHGWQRDDEMRGQGDTRQRVRSRAHFTTAGINYPTMTVDYFPLNRLSAGLGFRYVGSSRYDRTTQTAANGGATSRHTYEGSDYRITLTPRVGYALPLMDELSLWGRFGVEGSFSHNSNRNVSSENESAQTSAIGTLSSHSLSATGSFLLAYSPAAYFTVAGGPAITQRLATRTRTTHGENRTTTFDGLPFLSASLGVALRL